MISNTLLVKAHLVKKYNNFLYYCVHPPGKELFFQNAALDTSDMDLLDEGEYIIIHTRQPFRIIQNILIFEKFRFLGGFFSSFFFFFSPKAKLSLFYHVPRFESSGIACVEWLHDRAANLYSLFGTDLIQRIASYTEAANTISYFRRHTVLKIPNSYFQMLAGMM